MKRIILGLSVCGLILSVSILSIVSGYNLNKNEGECRRKKQFRSIYKECVISGGESCRTNTYYFLKNEGVCK